MGMKHEAVKPADLATMTDYSHIHVFSCSSTPPHTQPASDVERGSQAGRGGRRLFSQAGREEADRSLCPTTNPKVRRSFKGSQWMLYCGCFFCFVFFFVWVGGLMADRGRGAREPPTISQLAHRWSCKPMVHASHRKAN